MHSRTIRSFPVTVLAALSSCTLLTAAHVTSAHDPAPAVRSRARVAPVKLDLSPPVPAPFAADNLRPVASIDRNLIRDRASVSGKAMPRGDLPGWKQLLAQDFNGRALPSGWGTYDGRPGGNRYARWSSSQVSVKNGKLALSGSWLNGQYLTGGVMSWAARTTYGKFEVRFRVPKAHGVKYALLLWPSRGGWPATGEIDFAEDGDGARRGTTATLHYGADNRQVQRHLTADFTRWQTIGVEWTPGKLVYTLGGRPWATVRSGGVPRGPMDLALQLEAGAGDRWSSPPDARTPARLALEVDWAVGYRPA